MALKTPLGRWGRGSRSNVFFPARTFFFARPRLNSPPSQSGAVPMKKICPGTCYFTVAVREEGAVLSPLWAPLHPLEVLSKEFRTHFTRNNNPKDRKTPERCKAKECAALRESFLMGTRHPSRLSPPYQPPPPPENPAHMIFFWKNLYQPHLAKWKPPFFPPGAEVYKCMGSQGLLSTRRLEYQPYQIKYPKKNPTDYPEVRFPLQDEEQK